MYFLVTTKIEANNIEEAAIYMKKALQKGKIYEILEMPFYAQTYKSFTMQNEKIEKILNHGHVLEIKMTKGIYMVCLISSYHIAKDIKNMKILGNNLIFENISLDNFLDTMLKLLKLNINED